MKIKGRLIATLAALGLLIAMLPIGPASAAVGTVVLKGGAGGGAFFSDNDGSNIVTIEVTDEDLTPARPGIARQVLSVDKIGDQAGRTFRLAEMILGGEKARSDRFGGGNKTETVIVVNLRWLGSYCCSRRHHCYGSSGGRRP